MARKIYTALDLRGNTVANLTLGNYDDSLVKNPGALRFNVDENRIEFCDEGSNWRPLSTIERAVIDILLHRDDPDSSIVDNGIAYLDGILDQYAFKEGSFNNLFNAKLLQIGGLTETELIKFEFQLINNNPYLILSCPKTNNYIRIPFINNIDDLTNIAGNYVTIDNDQTIESTKTWNKFQIFKNSIRFPTNSDPTENSVIISGYGTSQLRFTISGSQYDFDSITALLNLETDYEGKNKVKTIAYKEDPPYYLANIDYFYGSTNTIIIDKPELLLTWYYYLYNRNQNKNLNLKSLKLSYSASNGDAYLIQLIDCNKLQITAGQITIFFISPIQFEAGGKYYSSMFHSNYGSTDPSGLDWDSYNEWTLIEYQVNPVVGSNYPGDYYVDLEN